MKFEIIERIVKEENYHINYEPFSNVKIKLDPSYVTYYDVVRSSDNKLIKSYDDLLEALHYKSELEKFFG